MIILIEGADAAGKTTHSERLVKAHSLKWYQFPRYESPTGKLIKSWLKREWRTDNTILPGGAGGAFTGDDMPTLWDPVRDAMVFQALQTTNKIEATNELLDDERDDTQVLITRYWPSAYVYGSADGLDKEWLLSLRAGLIVPHVYILLDIDTEQVFERRAADKRDRYEQDPSYVEKICRGYRDLWQQMEDLADLGHAYIVNARGPFEETAASLDEIIQDYLLD